MEVEDFGDWFCWSRFNVVIDEIDMCLMMEKNSLRWWSGGHIYILFRPRGCDVEAVEMPSVGAMKLRRLCQAWPCDRFALAARTAGSNAIGRIFASANKIGRNKSDWPES